MPADDHRRAVAFLAHRFPPLGGGGTPRSVKFVKHLATHGWRPVVFTGPLPTDRANRGMARDDSQLGELAGLALDVVRSDDAAGPLLRRAAAGPAWPLVRAIAYPWAWDAELPWARRTATAVVERHRAAPFDVIYASAGPNSAILAAARAAARTGVPFVADLRDLWTRESLKFFPSRLHYLWESRLERRLLRQAAAVIANTPGAADVLRRWLGPDRAARVTCIPNGYDPADVVAAAGRTRPPGSPIEILHAGTLYEPGEQHSRVGRYRPLGLVDAARSVEPLALGLLALERSDPALASRIRVRLLGYTPPKLRRRVEELDRAGRFSFEGVVPRAAALAAMASADALLVLQVAFVEADRPVPYVPGKAYEYLPLGKPILGPVPPGDLRNLLADMPHAYACGYRDPEEIARTLSRLCADIDRGAVRFDAAAITPYLRAAQAARLAEILERVATRTA